MKPLHIGLIGLDSSHVVNFCKLLNDRDAPGHVHGGRVVAAYPGGSPDFEKSISRVEGFTNQLRNEFDVQIFDSPEKVAECVDAVFITAVDGRTHLDYFKQILPSRKHVFIDKPMTLSPALASEIFDLAKAANVRVMSSSAKRYSDGLARALATAETQLGTIRGCDVFGPMDLEPTQNDVYWYGVHLVDMLYHVLGRGCRELIAEVDEHTHLIRARWEDGRVAVVRGMRNCKPVTGITIHGEKGTAVIDHRDDKRHPAAGLLEAVLDFMTDGKAGRLWQASQATSLTNPTGKLGIDPAETIECMRFLEAVNESAKSGLAVQL